MKTCTLPELVVERPTVGIVMWAFNRPDYGMWLGATQAAQEQDLNAVTFVGREIDSPQSLERQANAIYELIRAYFENSTLCCRADGRANSSTYMRSACRPGSPSRTSCRARLSGGRCSLHFHACVVRESAWRLLRNDPILAGVGVSPDCVRGLSLSAERSTQ